MSKKLYRCRWNRKISGVFGGIGPLIKVDPTILRLLAVFLIIPTGIITLPLIYLICSFIISEGPKAYIQPHYKKLTRDQKKRVFAGICAGIANYFNIDPTVVRIAFVILLFITGFIPLLISYFIGILIIPQKVIR